MEGKTQQGAAASAAMSERSARKWQGGALPSERKKARRRWRSRPDPFADVWESEVVPLLRSDPEGELSATTILEWLDERHPGRFGNSQLRTLQRRIRDYRALHGPDREVYFQQEHPPGRGGTGGLHTLLGAWGDHMRGALPSPAVPSRVEPLRMELCRGVLRRDVRGVGEGTAGSAMGAGRRAEGGAHGQLCPLPHTS